MSDYRFEQINDNSYKDIQELYLRSFNLKASIEDIRAKYSTEAFGLKNIGFLAIHTSNDLAAYYGAFPMRISINNKDYVCAQSGDTMTSPEHRKKGLFTELAQHTYKLAEDINLSFIFGFPNDNSYPGFKKKLNWQFYGSMKSFTLKNSVLPLCELAAKYKFLYPTYLNYCSSRLKKYKIAPTSENIEVFNDSAAYGYIKKDVDFFDYKLKNKSISLLKYNGFTLMIKTNPHLIIGAVGVFDKDKIDLFINTLSKLASKIGAKKTQITLSENHWLFKFLKEKVNYSDTLQIGYYEINKEIAYDRICFTQADYDTF